MSKTKKSKGTRRRVSSAQAAKVAAADAATLAAATAEVADDTDALPFEQRELSEKQLAECLRVVITAQGPDGKWNVPSNDFKLPRYWPVKIGKANWTQWNDRHQYHNLGVSKVFEYGEGRYHRDGAQNTYDKKTTPESEIGAFHKQHAILRYASLRSGEIKSGGGGVSVSSFVKYLRTNLVSWAVTNLHKKATFCAPLPTDEDGCKKLAAMLPGCPFDAIVKITHDQVKSLSSVGALPALEIDTEDIDEDE